MIYFTKPLGWYTRDEKEHSEAKEENAGYFHRRWEGGERGQAEADMALCSSHQGQPGMDNWITEAAEPTFSMSAIWRHRQTQRTLMTVLL